MAIPAGSLDGKHFIAESPSQLGRPMDLRWESAPDWVLYHSPDWMRRAEQSRHPVLPLVQLWDSSHFRLVLGFNQHGVPGVYLTQSLRN